jgi:hypothetical protein
MKPPTTKSDICTATKKDGTPCTMLHLPDSQYCGHHDPRLADKRKLASSLGGQARHHRHLKGEIVPVKFRTMEDAFNLLEWTIGDLRCLERSISRGKAIGNLIQVGMKVLEVGSMEERIRRLEAAVHGRDNRETIFEVEQIEKGETE